MCYVTLHWYTVNCMLLASKSCQSIKVQLSTGVAAFIPCVCMYVSLSVGERISPTDLGLVPRDLGMGKQDLFISTTEVILTLSLQTSMCPPSKWTARAGPQRRTTSRPRSTLGHLSMMPSRSVGQLEKPSPYPVHPRGRDGGGAIGRR